MKKLISAFAITLGWASIALAAAPATLTTLRSVTLLSHAEAAKKPPVAFDATVTYRRRGETTLFVQDGDAAIWIWANTNFTPVPGDRVRIEGTAEDSFHPIVMASNVTVLRHGTPPPAVPATFDDLIHARFDCRRVTVRGVVKSADLVMNSGHDATHLYLNTDGGVINMHIDSSALAPLQYLLDAVIEATGVAGADFDGKMQPVGVTLSVASLADIRIIKRAVASPWSLPVKQMSEIINDYHVTNLTRRVRVHGTITFYQPGSALVLQSGNQSLWVLTSYEKPLHIGYQADVTGFPDIRNGFLALTNGEIQESRIYAPIRPIPVTRSQLAASRNLFDLVSIGAQVVMEVRESAQDEYVLFADGQLFSAVYRHPDVADLLPLPMNRIPVGSKVNVTGICVLGGSNPFNHEVPFDVLMRTPNDITLVARPSPLNTRNLLILAGLLIVIVILIGVRGWSIEHRMRHQTAELASIERRRSRILEDINGSRPLAEVIEEITELVSFNLNGASCWCQIADGALLGDRPRTPRQLRILQKDIPARSGPPLGVFSVGFDPLVKPLARECEAISLGTELAALAIEARRLYSDLLHRSEYDLLTDIHNRFSLDKQMDVQIEGARQNAVNFGLVYIDLDNFKQINDQYGHHVGDLILQEAALRMKSQLRPCDMLARLGGDEFAALVPTVRSRAEVEEIAQRMERCFDEPFALEGHLLHGSASIGFALYPDDGENKDSLLNFADAAMYVSKHAKRQRGQLPKKRR